MTPESKTFPKELIVRRDDDSDNPFYYGCDLATSDLENRETVAVYELREVKRVKITRVLE